MGMDPNLIINALGGTTAVAKLCEVRPASVSQWRDHGIPKARLMFLRLARPDVFSNVPADPNEADRAPEASAA